MKRILLSAAVLALGGSAAFAATGDMGIGINLGAAPCIEKHSSVTNFILGAKFQYQATSLIRLQADVDFGFRDKSVSSFTAMANVHFMIPCADRFYLYPLAGLGYGNVKFSGSDWSYSKDKFAFNIGLGAEYEITSNFAANFEFKYLYMKDFNRLPILAGLTYKF